MHLMKVKIQKAQNSCNWLCLNLPLRSRIIPSHFRKITCLLANDWVEYCIVDTAFKYWNGIVPGYIQEMFKPSLYRYSTRSNTKQIQNKKVYIFLGLEIWLKLNVGIENIKKRFLLWMLKGETLYFIWKHMLIQIIILSHYFRRYYH